MKNIRIGIAYHNKNTFFKNDFFYPIHVGASKSNLKLEIQRDDEGINISKLNCYCSELTATYWLWKNNSNHDYYGLVHYRRFFSFERPNLIFHLINGLLFLLAKTTSLIFPDARYSTKNSLPQKIKSTELEFYLNEFSEKLATLVGSDQAPDCLCLYPIRSSARSNRKSFSLALGMFTLKKIETIINEHHAVFVPYLNKSLNSSSYSPCNMIIMKKEDFNDYCDFMFNVIFKYHSWALNGVDHDGVNNLAVRSSGYIGELLTDIYIRKLISEKKKIKKLYMKELENEGTELSSKQTSLIRRIKRVLCGDY